MRIYKLTPNMDFNPCLFQNPEIILEYVYDLGPGESFSIEVVEMREEEYKALALPELEEE